MDNIKILDTLFGCNYMVKTKEFKPYRKNLYKYKQIILRDIIANPEKYNIKSIEPISLELQNAEIMLILLSFKSIDNKEWLFHQKYSPEYYKSIFGDKLLALPIKHWQSTTRLIDVISNEVFEEWLNYLQNIASDIDSVAIKKNKKSQVTPSLKDVVKEVRKLYPKLTFKIFSAKHSIDVRGWWIDKQIHIRCNSKKLYNAYQTNNIEYYIQQVIHYKYEKQK